MSAEDLTYLMPVKVTRGYSEVTVRRPEPISGMMHLLQKDAIHSPNRMRGLASSRCSPSYRKWYQFLLPAQHLMLLDSDSIPMKDEAVSYLKTRGIDHTLIESTPGKFWIVCDVVGTFQEVMRCAEIVPGVDGEYLNLSRKEKQFVLRCYPKLGKAPLFCDLSFLSVSDCEATPYTKWLCDFHDFWNGDENKIILDIAAKNQPSACCDYTSIPPKPPSPKKPVTDVIFERIQKDLEME